jgi:hypothetical protein
LYIIFSISGSIFLLLKDSYFQGRSPAKVLTRLRVIDADTGLPISPLQSVARNLVFLIPFFPLIELIVANARADRRRLGDLLANTLVMSEDAWLRRVPKATRWAEADHSNMTIGLEAGARRDIQSSEANDASTEIDASVILLACPSCARTFKVPEEFLGRRLKCTCGQVFAPNGDLNESAQ